MGEIVKNGLNNQIFLMSQFVNEMFKGKKIYNILLKDILDGKRKKEQKQNCIHINLRGKKNISWSSSLIRPSNSPDRILT